MAVWFCSGAPEPMPCVMSRPTAPADRYYLGDATGISYAVVDASGEANSRSLSSDDYAGWVDWSNPDTGERMGRPRLRGVGSSRLTSVRRDGHQHSEISVHRRRSPLRSIPKPWMLRSRTRYRRFSGGSLSTQ